VVAWAACIVPGLLRREPYRLFFPLGLVLGIAGVVPWILFGRGLIHTWPGLSHSLVMSQGFFVSVAIGFLGTMLPRRTGTAPLPGALIGALALAAVLSSGALLAGAVGVAQVIFLAVLVGMVTVVAPRVRKAPPSFVLVAGGFVLAAVGSAVLLAGVAPGLGRALVSQGLMLSLVLAVAPFLIPGILRGEAARRELGRPVYLGMAALLGASFAVEEWLSIRAGLVARGAIVAGALLLAGVLSPATRPGAHRAAFRLALLLVPLGLVAAGLVPERRIALLHVTHVGGLALLIVAVTVHVTLLHGGRERLAARWPVPVVAAATCLLAAAGLRASLESFGASYTDAMSLAGALWVAAVIVWGGFLLRNLRRAS
jgi:uncharacterized protein involved in response to NO